MTLQPGQSLYDLFSRHDLSQGDLVTMVKQDRRIKKALRRIQPGRAIHVTAAPAGKIEAMVVERSGPQDLLIERDSEGRFRISQIDDRPRPEDGERDGTADTPPLTIASQEASESSQPKLEEEESASASVQASTLDQEDDGPETGPGGTGLIATDPTALHSVTVKSGDSLFRIFKRLGIPPQDLARLLDADKQTRGLRNLRPGQELSVGMTHDKRLHSFGVELDEERTLSAARADNGDYRVTIQHQPLERRISTASAVIESSLFLAGQRAGLSDRVIMEVTEIFGWDVDFALDVRAGDRFTVIFEELYKNGEKVRDGHILASEFINRGRSVRAIRFVDSGGHSAYYSPEGLSMRKAFLRTPVRFSRISSRFSRGRMHPVLQRMRAHKGVDYAAPTGTAIRATGDGRVVFAGTKGGYGRTVILQHGSAYTTLYAHMSRLNKRARKGNRVRQGDVIGYVGKTGLATGPHLHYEFRVRGAHVDPLRVKLPKALPIEARYKAAFLRASRPLVSQLDTLANTSLAARD